MNELRPLQAFVDLGLCAVIVDQVFFNAHTIEIGTVSFRLAQTKGKPPNLTADDQRRSTRAAGGSEFLAAMGR
ncbi:hypothetical protein ACIA8E_32825 [Streptomyces sp. NPDC051664]|uniref:hypothetical protein n=1 Tax=Streptomyces sp. NPDC051664 TaxID=3365668 RepID=UPI00379CF39D